MKTLQDFDFSKNPFESILGGMGGGMQNGPMSPPAANQPAQQAQAPQGASLPVRNPEMEQEEEPEEDQLKRGKNPSRTAYLVKAVTALEDYVTSATDRAEIMYARGLISAVSRLINRDQETLKSKVMQPGQ